MEKSKKPLKKLLEKAGLENLPLETINVKDLRDKLTNKPSQAIKDFKTSIGPSNLSKLIEAMRNNPELRSEIEDNNETALPKYSDIAPFILPAEYQAELNEADNQEKGSFMDNINSGMTPQVIEFIWSIIGAWLQ